MIEGGRLTHHLDLRPLIDVPDVFDPGDDEGRIDWQAFDAAVPATLRGPLLRRGEELRPLDVRRDFVSTESDLPALYPDHPLGYGMSLWMDNKVTDEPRRVLHRPTPAEISPRDRTATGGHAPGRQSTARRNPSSLLMVVDFPAPFGAGSATVSPRPVVRLRPSPEATRG
ncbi:hypothetical protein GCM10029978_029390 [Actinoallomurus acanthiterrae]